MSDESDDPSDPPDGADDEDGLDPSRDGEESRDDGDASNGTVSGDDGDASDGPDGGSSGGDGSGEGGPADGGPGDGAGGGADPERVQALAQELQATRAELSELEERVDEKTVHRDDITAELKRYVRARQRRGHATGWGPYLVLLYGTGMSLGAFYYLGGWVVVAVLLVVWLSTLGLYVVMLFAGALIGAGRKLGGARDVVGKLRR